VSHAAALIDETSNSDSLDLVLALVILKWNEDRQLHCLNQPTNTPEKPSECQSSAALAASLT